MFSLYYLKKDWIAAVIKMILRYAKIEEADECYRILDEGRNYQNSQGFEQWLKEYPAPETVTEDIAEGIGYVFEDEKGLIGYCAIIFTGEPVYSSIEGEWKTDNPYAVVHRIAFGDNRRGTGCSKKAFDLIKEYAHEKGFEAVRIDTKAENKVMQHIVQREGFQYCGIVYYNGSPRLAYEWNNKEEEK